VPFLIRRGERDEPRRGAAKRQGVKLFITGASPAVRRALLTMASPRRGPLPRNHRPAPWPHQGQPEKEAVKAEALAAS